MSPPAIFKLFSKIGLQMEIPFKLPANDIDNWCLSEGMMFLLMGSYMFMQKPDGCVIWSYFSFSIKAVVASIYNAWLSMSMWKTIAKIHKIVLNGDAKM